MFLCPLRPAGTSQVRGVALIIVLAFVVLLTGLILAFFSRSLSERQISNNSASQVKIDLFTQGAIATIVGDLKQEMSSGSNATYYTSSASGPVLGSVFLPDNPATAVPALALKGQQSIVTSFPANLLKRSAYGQNFFPGSNDTGGTNYNNGNTVSTVVEPPSGTPVTSAAPTPSPANRAANVSSTIVSQNGRTISPARWNKPLLLPKSSPASSTDNTPYYKDPGNHSNTSAASGNNAYFVPPDWINVARDGSNPGSLNNAATFTASGTAVNNGAASNSGYVTGRYAYAIYDEGGLLDANVAGYPTAAGKYPSENPSPTAPVQVIPQGKPLLAYADLTIPIPTDSTNPAGGTQTNMLTDTQVNALVGWRNYASSKPSGGSFPLYTPGPTTYPSPTSTPIALGFSAFDSSLLANLNGFVGASNAPLYNAQSDRTFGSRQELINFFTQGLVSSTKTADVAAMQNSLQYLGTFSRGLNQPSYMPVSRVANSTYNPNPRPAILPSAPAGSQPGGGNSVGDNYTVAQQDIFSPSLLSVRVEPSKPQWIRSDGATASVAGEPLIKKRFALQRLAWITYLGPSASHLTDPNVQLLTTTYGIPKSYLAQGTAANIQAYFGLTWDSTNNCWNYVHNGANTGSGAIMKLSEIADQKVREPDFFELLKASVDLGALGKASTSGPVAEQTEQNANPPNNTHYQPLNYQFFRDVDVDGAIIQLGANIVDQFDLDGYPTRIVFNNGSVKHEFHGVENLPYIYRIRTASLKVRESNPASEIPPTGSGSALVPKLHSGTQPGYTAQPLIDTGAGVVMSVPDIWNPCDQNCPLGEPRPGEAGGNSPQIRLAAFSANPDFVYTTNGVADPTYSTYTSGGFIETSTTPPLGGLRATSYANAVTPDATAKPPIPYFTRAVNTDGTSTVAMSGTNGGFNYPHNVSPGTTGYLTFQVPAANNLFHEPTVLGQSDLTGPSALSMVVPPAYLDIINLQGAGGVKVYTSGAGLKSLDSNPLGLPGVPTTTNFVGLILGTCPLRWVGPRWSGSATGTLWNYSDAWLSDGGSPVASMTYSLQYLDPVGKVKWISYDDKYVDSDVSFVKTVPGMTNQQGGGNYTFADPRTAHFGSPTENNISGNPFYRAPLTSTLPTTWASTWLAYSTNLPLSMTERPDSTSGFGSNFRGTSAPDWGGYAAPGLHMQGINTTGGVNAIFFQTGLLGLNNPYLGSDGIRFTGDNAGGAGVRDPVFWTGADGIVRRAMGGYAVTGAGQNTTAATSTVGQPLATATTVRGTAYTPSTQSQSRPIILNRPFRSVGELGYVFSGNPWMNIDFSKPESAYSELLDVFCISDNTPANALVAGTVDLNTRQPAVLQSVLAGAYTDEENSYYPAVTIVTPFKPLTATDASAIAAQLVSRVTKTSSSNSVVTGPQPLQNIGDLVGRWSNVPANQQTITRTYNTSLPASHNLDGSRCYDGFSGDLSQVTSLTSLPTDTMKIPRMRESAVRALSSVGNTRVWNLMIDVIAQSGRYPPGASSAQNFVVEGEERCWMHLAIDRYTGTVLDSKLEVVKE